MWTRSLAGIVWSRRSRSVHSYRYRCTLESGYCLYMVQATDAAGSKSETSLDPQNAVFKRVCRQLLVRWLRTRGSRGC